MRTAAQIDKGILDDKMQRQLALSSFFQGAGYKIFKAEMDDLVYSAKSTIEEYSKTPIQLDRLSGFNFDNGYKKGVDVVLNILQGLEEELESVNKSA